MVARDSCLGPRFAASSTGEYCDQLAAPQERAARKLFYWNPPLPSSFVRRYYWHSAQHEEDDVFGIIWETGTSRESRDIERRTSPLIRNVFTLLGEGWSEARRRLLLVLTNVNIIICNYKCDNEHRIRASDPHIPDGADIQLFLGIFFHSPASSTPFSTKPHSKEPAKTDKLLAAAMNECLPDIRQEYSIAAATELGNLLRWDERRHQLANGCTKPYTNNGTKTLAGKVTPEEVQKVIIQWW